MHGNDEETFDASLAEDEPYFEESETREPRAFDAALLREPLTVIPTRTPLIFSTKSTVSQAMRAMQDEHRGYVLITEDGTKSSRLAGIFTERDVLNRVIDRGRNPSTVPLEDVMTRDPETLPVTASVAWVLNKMELGGFRHVAAVDDAGRPKLLIAMRDVVSFLVDAFPQEVLNLPPEVGCSRFDSRDGA